MVLGAGGSGAAGAGGSAGGAAGGGGGAVFFTTFFFGATFLGATFLGAAFLGGAVFTAFFGAAFLTAFLGAAFLGAAFFGAAFLAAFFTGLAAFFAGFFLVAILVYLEHFCAPLCGSFNISSLVGGKRAILIKIVQQRLRSEPELAQEIDGEGALAGCEPTGGARHGGFVIGESASDRLAAVAGEMHDARAAIGRIVAAFHHAFAFEAIDGGGDGSAAEADFGADDIHRRRAFVQQVFHYREV